MSTKATLCLLLLKSRDNFSDQRIGKFQFSHHLQFSTTVNPKDKQAGNNANNLPSDRQNGRYFMALIANVLYFY